MWKMTIKFLADSCPRVKIMIIVLLSGRAPSCLHWNFFAVKAISFSFCLPLSFNNSTLLIKYESWNLVFAFVYYVILSPYDTALVATKIIKLNLENTLHKKQHVHEMEYTNVILICACSINQSNDYHKRINLKIHTIMSPYYFDL